LLVVTAGDAENVALPLIAKRIAGHLSAHLVPLAILQDRKIRRVSIEHTRFL
jgi:hypothetical protein